MTATSTGESGMDVGDLVICIDDKFGSDDCVENLPCEGRVYTIAEWRRDEVGGVWGINLIELGPRNVLGYHTVYASERFKPVRDDEIEIFRKIVKDVSDDESVVV